MSVILPQKDLLLEKAYLPPSLEGISCKQGALYLVEILGSHQCCRDDGFYLNLIGKYEELWVICVFSTQGPGDPVFKQGWGGVGYSCVLIQQMFLEHLLPAMLLQALMKEVNKINSCLCLGPGPSPSLKTLVLSPQVSWLHGYVAKSPSVK